MSKYEKLSFLNLHAVHIHTIAYEVITNKAWDSTNQVKLSGWMWSINVIHSLEPSTALSPAVSDWTHNSCKGDREE